MAGHTLVFYSAAWCDPGVPMNKIFHEILRDVARARPDVSLKGIEIDVDTEEENQQTGALSPAVSEGSSCRPKSRMRRRSSSRRCPRRRCRKGSAGSQKWTVKYA